MQNVTALELAKWLADATRTPPFLLDVREMREYEICHLDNSTLIPMTSIPERMAELDENTEIVCICHHGGRSMQVANYLERNGFAKITNLTGGVHAWSQLVDPDMPTY
jgi:rhodanese-related sulfurtransferase